MVFDTHQLKAVYLPLEHTVRIHNMYVYLYKRVSMYSMYMYVYTYIYVCISVVNIT